MKGAKMRKLTQREKILLMVVALLGVVVGFVMLGIQPLQTAASEKRSEISALSGEEMTLKSVVTSEDAIRAAYATQSLEADTLRNTFPRQQKSYEIHTSITGICTAVGAQVTSLQIGEYAVASDESGKLVAGTEALWECSASLQVNGTPQQLLQLEDTLCHTSSNMVVRSFTLAGLDAESEATASIQLAIFAIDEAPADAIATPAPTEESGSDEAMPTGAIV